MLRRRREMWVTIGLDCQKYIPELPVAFKKAIHSLPTGPGSLQEPPTEEKVQPSFATDAELTSGVRASPPSADAGPASPVRAPATTAPTKTLLRMARLYFILLLNIRMAGEITTLFCR